MTDRAPTLGEHTDVHVPSPPPPDLSLPRGAIACTRRGGKMTEADAKAVRDFAAFLEQQGGKPPPTADEPLPKACMDGVCACPPAPDGADQHADADPLCTRKGCGQPASRHELGGIFCP